LAQQSAVAEACAECVLDLAAAAIASRGRFAIVLAGGSTPAAAYRLLALADSDWSRWHVYFGDERCLPPDDPERNSRMAADALLDLVPIPARQVHPIPAERGPVEAAAAYADLIRSEARFDLVLLGIGEDGHTASLFPGRLVPEGETVIPVCDAPKPPPQRVSLTPVSLCRSRRILLLATGAAKRDALASWASGQALPAAEVAACGKTLVLADVQAVPPGIG
jgi:6-phosphogluconolactonase